MATPTYDVVCIAHDASPSRAFVRLAEELRAEGISTLTLVGDGQRDVASHNEVVNAVKDTRLLLLGLSASSDVAWPETTAAVVAGSRVPYGFYSDAPLAWRRAMPGGTHAEVADEARFCVGITRDKRESVRSAQEAFPHAKIIETGNPLREEWFYPEYQRPDVRSALGIGVNEHLLLAPGGKDVEGNRELWKLLVEGVNTLRFPGSWRIILTNHPGDEYARSPGAYEDIERYAVGVCRVTRAFGSLRSTADLMVGADVVASFGTEDVTAACLRIPHLTIRVGRLVKRYERVFGVSETEAERATVSASCEPLPGVIGDMLMRYLDGENRELWRGRQELQYPKPEKRGAVLAKMVEAIDQILRA